MPRKQKILDPATAAFDAGCKVIYDHPLFGGMLMRARVTRREGNGCPGDGWTVVTSTGWINVHSKRRAEPAEWAYVLAHCLLHLAFDHFNPPVVIDEPAAWAAACDATVGEFLHAIKIGRPPPELSGAMLLPTRGEPALYRRFKEHGVPNELRNLGTAGPGRVDFVHEPPPKYGDKFDWPRSFAVGLRAAVTDAVDVAGGRDPFDPGKSRLTAAELARRWFVGQFPLLGALAAGFKIVEDNLVCVRMEISVAAVDAEGKVIYMNPSAHLDGDECRFVMAHELLHVGLAHHSRRRGRDPYLWNVACDYVINQWLVEMGVGAFPRFGGLLDPELKDLSAESIYDRIATDLRRYRKLTTFRGVGIGDMLPEQHPDWWAAGDGCTLDEFYRRCMAQGLAMHDGQGRGLLPAGLVEEVRALAQPPLPWDVELARWFDAHFRPVEKRRTYARPSRRQSATPDLPRPAWAEKPDARDGRTFGVVLDTSGSMDRKLLAMGLGAIAGFAASREVPAARVIFCDAVAHDAGYLSPDEIADRVKVRGRGGTVLQPGIDLLESAGDFPKDGPILVITDGQCDRVRIRRSHAFLMPEGTRLPFVPVGPVFRMK